MSERRQREMRMVEKNNNNLLKVKCADIQKSHCEENMKRDVKVKVNVICFLSITLLRKDE